MLEDERKEKKKKSTKSTTATRVKRLFNRMKKDEFLFLKKANKIILFSVTLPDENSMYRILLW